MAGQKNNNQQMSHISQTNGQLKMAAEDTWSKHCANNKTYNNQDENNSSNKLKHINNSSSQKGNTKMDNIV